MFNHKHYVPILKGRAGEFGALRTMDPNKKLHLTPLLEIPPVPLDYESETPKKELETHLDHIVKYIADSWEKERPFFIDLLWDAEDEHTEDGRHPLKYLNDKALENGLQGSSS